MILKLFNKHVYLNTEYVVYTQQGSNYESIIILTFKKATNFDILKLKYERINNTYVWYGVHMNQGSQDSAFTVLDIVFSIKHDIEWRHCIRWNVEHILFKSTNWRLNLRFNDVLDNQLYLQWKKRIAKLCNSIHQRNLYVALIQVINNAYS